MNHPSAVMGVFMFLFALILLTFGEVESPVEGLAIVVTLLALVAWGMVHPAWESGRKRKLSSDDECSAAQMDDLIIPDEERYIMPMSYSVSHRK